ncbi:MAG: MutT/NUDIX family protein [Erysipelotrichaceae bacterium]|nr:MAG: MutT/NUDIX family protein [Erysipelotrichaceae bacterium]
MIRFTARVFVFDQEGRIGYLRIIGEDGFGKRNHLETPGGGVELNETFVEAAIREIDEELGATATNFKEIGVVIDRYNVINRMTFSVYYQAQLESLHKNTQRTEEEMVLIDSVVWLSIPEIEIELSEEESDVDHIIHRRERCAFSALLEDLKNRG